MQLLGTWLLLFATFACGSPPQPATTTTPMPPPTTMTPTPTPTPTPAAPPGPKIQANFLVVYRQGPAWIAGKSVMEQPLKEHGKFILGLYKKGILQIAGPFLDDTGGAAALMADNEEAAKAILAMDPAVTSGVMIAELHPWKLVNWDALIKK